MKADAGGVEVDHSERLEERQWEELESGRKGLSHDKVFPPRMCMMADPVDTQRQGPEDDQGARDGFYRNYGLLLGLWSATKKINKLFK